MPLKSLLPSFWRCYHEASWWFFNFCSNFHSGHPKGKPSNLALTLPMYPLPTNAESAAQRLKIAMCYNRLSSEAIRMFMAIKWPGSLSITRPVAWKGVKTRLHMLVINWSADWAQLTFVTKLREQLRPQQSKQPLRIQPGPQSCSVLGSWGEKSKGKGFSHKHRECADRLDKG